MNRQASAKSSSVNVTRSMATENLSAQGKGMNWSRVSLDAVVSQPWRNGGGVTRELLTWPSAKNWKLRISVADVCQDGPFSRFEGIERSFAVLDGKGLELRIDGETHHVSPARVPLRFDGSAAVDCKLIGGPTRDLNLMAAPGRARMKWVVGGPAFTTSPPALLAIYTHDQPAWIDVNGEAFTLPPFHLTWCHARRATTARIRGDKALWIEFTP